MVVENVHQPTESEGYKRKLRSSTSTAKRRMDLYDADDTGVEPMLLDEIDEWAAIRMERESEDEREANRARKAYKRQRKQATGN